MAWKEKGEEKHACMQGGKLAGKVVLEVAQQVHAARQEWPAVADEILRDEGGVLSRLFRSRCSSEEDFEEIKEVIESMSLLGRKVRARELASSALRVLDQRFLEDLTIFLGALDLSLEVDVPRGEL